MLYAGWTLVSAAFSPERAISFTDCKQLVLLLLVPLTYEIVDEGSAMMLTTIILAAGAVSAVVGIGQYSILHYDNLGQRPRSTLGLYMTFSGLMMLVLNVALARVLFMTRSRHVAGARHAGAGRRARADLHAQRVGRRVLRRRAAADDARLPADGGAAGGRRDILRDRAGAGPPALLLHLQPAGPHDQRSVCDDARRQADHRGPSRVRRRAEHDRTRLPAVSRRRTPC